VFSDCPGPANVLSAALAAADRALVVAQPTQELEGLPALEQTIAKVASLYNTALRLSAVIPRIVPPSSSGRLYADGLTSCGLYAELVTSPIRRSVGVPEAPQSHAVADGHQRIVSAVDDGGRH
jgi:cellulose biosynthesis protein BcsQ